MESWPGSFPRFEKGCFFHDDKSHPWPVGASRLVLMNPSSEVVFATASDSRTVKQEAGGFQGVGRWKGVVSPAGWTVDLTS